MPLSAGSWLPRRLDLDLVIYVDGSSVPNPGPSGIGLLVLARFAEGDSLYGCLKNIGYSGNNATELAGLLEALGIVRQAHPRGALILSDSMIALRLLIGAARGGAVDHGAPRRQAAVWLKDHPTVELCWVERRRNLAHHLAREAAGLPPGEQSVTHLGTRSHRLRLAS
ncbi:MAG: RNase H family protein [Chloroflexota bacterium]